MGYPVEPPEVDHEAPPVAPIPSPVRAPTPFRREVVALTSAMFVDETEARVLDEQAGFVPSDDQYTALATLITALKRPGIYQLRGAAGSGKTTCVRALIRRLGPMWSIALLAPTWAAANRLKALSGMPAVSLHSYIYGYPVEERRCTCGQWSADIRKPQEMEIKEEHGGVMISVTRNRYICPHCKHAYVDLHTLQDRLTFPLRGGAEGERGCRLVVIDEASMISKRTLLDIEAAVLDDHTRVLLVGDPNQIPPISTPESPEEPIDFSNPTAKLDKIHRQAADNPTLILAHANKTNPAPAELPAWPFPQRWTGDPRVSIRVGGLPDIAYWQAGLRSQGRDVVTIALSNVTRAQVNCYVRRYLGTEALSQQQDVPFVPGDRIALRGNSLASEVYSGEQHVICSITRVAPWTSLLKGNGRAEDTRVGTSRRSADAELLDALDIGVWKIETWPTYAPTGTRRSGIIVAARENGKWAMESDYLIAEAAPGTARNMARGIVRAWVREYREAVAGLSAVWQKERDIVEATRGIVAHLRTFPSIGATVTRLIETLLQNCDKQHDSEARARFRRLHEAGQHDVLLSEVLPPERIAWALAETVEEYARLRYDALDTHRVWVVDYGECVTGHAMQGSQAAHVGMVCDRGYWGMWAKNRIGAMQWTYTGQTRTTFELVMFRVPKQ